MTLYRFGPLRVPPLPFISQTRGRGVEFPLVMTSKGPIVAGALLMWLGALSVPASSRQATAGRPSPPARPDAFETSIKPFLKTYCYGCHSGNQPAAGFDLASY